MSRPLLISDCDEVLLHMVRHFANWLGEVHEVDFTIGSWELARSMKRRGSGAPLTREEMFSYLGGFFPEQMHRQTLVPNAREALAALAGHADIVILTNLEDHCRTHRIDQLAGHGIAHRVECNQGGKGAPVARLVAEYGAPVTVFVDDLPHHHESVAQEAPGVWRLHMVSEPGMVTGVPPAPHAHARIDDWREAQDWIAARFDAGVPAEA
ncbi:hypothetical protein [Sphingomonas endophytica]|uniref:HAD family hydrolase n=1 Tax=Sphingomonas endophytica TaxID=869719 RepID=A0A147I871_9SPHN|nr:hypothetical protein [Sphingomonas endophytica]KTT75338.1 hypothetical protein NS334_03565 [Sphingomonas endophytica]